MTRGRNAYRLLVLLGVAWLACPSFRTSESTAALDQAVADLARAGFPFDVDVRFRRDRSEVCDGLACARLVLLRGRRTLRIAPEAFESDSRLRATLLEIWERYKQPRSPSLRDMARGVLRVVRDGPRVGVTDRFTLRRAHHIYRQIWEQLSRDQRSSLPDPDDIPFP